MSGPRVPERAGRTRGRGLLRGALFASLALNLVVVGVVLGAVAGHRQDIRDRGSAIRVDGPNPFVRALSPADALALRRAMKSREAEIGASRAALRTRMASLLDTLRSDTLDKDRLARIFAEQAQLAETRSRIGQKLLLDRLASMSQQDRLDFADRLEDALRHPLRDRDRDRDDPGGRPPAPPR